MSHPQGIAYPPSSSVSFIPVMAAPVPRKASKSGAFGLSPFSLLPSPRSTQTRLPTAASSSPQVRQNSISPSPAAARSGDIGYSPSSPHSSPSHSNGGSSSSIPKFRSLRNMLPFGPKQSSPGSPSSSYNPPPPTSWTPAKSQHPPALSHRRSSSSIPAAQSTPKPNFLTFGPRKSFSASVDRKSSAPPTISRSRSEDHGASPIITISGPPPSRRPSLESAYPHYKAQSISQESSSPSPRLSLSCIGKDNFDISDDIFEQQGEARSGDLSTIMEAEMSSMSMSRHLPPLDISQEAFEPLNVDLDHPAGENDKNRDVDLAFLARQLHQRSVNMMKAESLDYSMSPISPPKGTQMHDLSQTWDAGLSAFQQSLGGVGNGNPKPSGHGFTSHSNAAVPEQSDIESSSPESAPSPLNVLGTPSDDFQPETPDDGEDVKAAQMSFDLSGLDPDLAELLSPHNMASRHSEEVAAIQAAVEAITPPPTMSLSPSPSPEPVPPSTQASKRASVESDHASSHRRSGESSRYRMSSSQAIGPQSSPRKSRPSSLTISVTSSNRDQSIDLRRTSMDNSARSSLDTSRMTVTESSGAKGAEERVPKSRPFLGRSSSGLAGTSTTNSSRTELGVSTRNRPQTSRLEIPPRPLTAASRGGAKSRFASDGRRRGSLDTHRDRDSSAVASPSDRDRPPSAFGTSLSARRSANASKPSPSDPRPSSALSISAYRSNRTRRRSMSLSAGINDGPSSTTGRGSPALKKTMDWMGPRTVRALTAAGLLNPDADKDSSSREESGLFRSVLSGRSSGGGMGESARARSGTVNSSSRANAPSRSGFSDVSRSASWGKNNRSASRAGTMSISELGRVESPLTATTTSASLTPTTTTNTRGALSASTATSMSIGIIPNADAYHQNRMESALQNLKDKHALETEALLNALVDSQRSTRELKDENMQLKGRVQDLEEQIRDLVDRIESSRHLQQQHHRQQHHHHLGQQKSHLGSSHGGMSRSSRSSSTEGVQRRQHALMQSFVMPLEASTTSYLDDHRDIDDPTFKASTATLTDSNLNANNSHTLYKRASTASSVFPVLPSNMSMLLHEGSDDPDASSAGMFLNFPMSRSRSASQPPSPTLQISHHHSTSINGRQNKHVAKQSVSSIGSILSSDADTSVFSLPGSPGSLRLKPEHEEHLEEMMSMDFSLVDSDN